MSTPSLAIFANFRIDNEERYQRMKSSFMSFKDINAQKWVINVRGTYKLKTILFLREQLGELLYPHLLESGKGWFYDTRQIIIQIDTDYVFFWIEDHINLVPVARYDNLLIEMEKHGVDHLMYSWYHERIHQYLSYLNYDESENLKIYKFNEDNVKLIKDKIDGKYYIISATSILDNEYFKKIINSNHPKIKRWPKETPFDFEKISTDVEFLPFVNALCKYELFASIDDDHGEKGYSLISRGLYENTMSRSKIKSVEYPNTKNRTKYFRKILPDTILNMMIFIYSLYKRLTYTLK
jgi:hypothetical protein